MMVANFDDSDRETFDWDDAPAVVPRGNCPAPALLRAEAEGVLPDALAARVRAHLLTCGWCRRLHQLLGEVEVEPLATDEEQRIRARIARRRPGVRPRYVAWGSALAAAAVVLLAVWLPRPSLPPAPNPPPASPVPAPRRVAPTAEVFAARPAAIELPAASLLSRGSATSFAQRFASALAPYSAGDYAGAERRLEPLTVEAPADASAQFYLGASRLLAGRAEPAIMPLLAARRLDRARFEDGSTWYLAVAYDKTAQRDQAVAELTRLCGRNLPHGADACAALEVLSLR